MTNLEFLTEWKIWSHPYSFSILICSPLLCWVGFDVWWEPGEISASAQSCWFFSDYQSKEKCHAKEMTGDYWANDLICSEAEIWTLHQWQHQRDHRSERLPGFTWHRRRLGGTGIQGPAPQGIFLALLIKWPTEDGEQPQPGVFSYSLKLSSVLWHLRRAAVSLPFIPILPKPILIPAAQWWLHYQQTGTTHCKSERMQF